MTFDKMVSSTVNENLLQNLTFDINTFWLFWPKNNPKMTKKLKQIYKILTVLIIFDIQYVGASKQKKNQHTTQPLILTFCWLFCPKIVKIEQKEGKLSKCKPFNEIL